MVAIYAEAVWQAEFTPPNLAKLISQLQALYGSAAVGSKGDAEHLYGYHRSRNWILRSSYSAYGSGDYSVQVQQDKAGDGDWLAAVDVNPGSTEALIAMCRRLDAAVHAGKCPQLREWFGNLDGDQVVDGWDLVQQRAASSDSSHLWHLHMSFLRGRANDDHAALFAILTGTETGDDDMPKFFRVDQTGLVGITNGPSWYHLPSDAALDGALRIWGQTRADIIAINEHDLIACGQQVFPPSSSGGPEVLVPHTHPGGQTGPAQPD